MATNITPPRVDFIDPRTNQISRPWYLFLLSLFQATGSGETTVSLTDLLVAPSAQPSVDFEELANALAQLNSGGVGPVDVRPEASELVYPTVFDLSPMWDKIDGLSVAPVPQPALPLTSGRATLVAGTVVVANPNVNAASNIMLTSQVDGGTPGWLRVSARTAGTSFTITSSSLLDTSTIAYHII